LRRYNYYNYFGSPNDNDYYFGPNYDSCSFLDYYYPLPS
tara:strand:- start:870 stop:986 length:117 start_codon:yes stop_codon:yes gene_type:complete